MEEIKRIYYLLLHNNGIKIKDIAKKLDLDKYYVADILFSTDNICFWYQDCSSLWFAKEGAIDIDEPKEDQLTAPIDVPKVFNTKRFLQGYTSSALRSYLNQLPKYRVYSEEELTELFIRYRNGDKKAHELIVKSLQKLVAGIAVHYTKYGMPLEDIVQEGNIGLLKAIERFDYLHYHNFRKFAKGWVLQSISTSMATLPYMVRLPLNQFILYRKVCKFKEKYEQQNGYLPSVNAIEIDDENAPDKLSFLDNLPDNLKNTCILCENLDVFEDNHNDILEHEDKEDKVSYVKGLLAQLSERQRGILIRTFGIGVREDTLEIIGESFGLTRERVRQIKEKAIRKLRDIAQIVKQENAIAFDNKIETFNNVFSFKSASDESPFADTVKTLIEKENKRNAKAAQVAIVESNPLKDEREAKCGTNLHTILKGNIEKQLDSEVDNTIKLYPVDELQAVDNDFRENITENKIAGIDNNTPSIDKIYEVFNNTVSTYKFYWFISILQIFKETKDPIVYVYDIIARMVANAWCQITCHRLSFGNGDSLHMIVHELQKVTDIPNNVEIEVVYNFLKTRQDEPLIKRQLQILTKNVPSRFLSPWIERTSDGDFNNPECLYSLKMGDEHPFISISPLWSDFLQQNHKKLLDFSYQGLASFLQKRNPNVDNILSKLKDNVKRNSNLKEYTIAIMGNQCAILDAYDVRVYSSNGRIKEFNSIFYRFYYTYSSFTVNIIQLNERNHFVTGKRIIKATCQTPLYKALDEKCWLTQIETIVCNGKQGYSIKVAEKWYNENGYEIIETQEESIAHVTTQEKEDEKDLPTLLSNKKTTLLSYNGREFRWNVGDYVTLGLMFSGPVSFLSDPFFLFRRNILFVFMKSESDNYNELGSVSYLLWTDTHLFKREFDKKYGRKTPRILLFFYKSPTAVRFLDEVKIQSVDTNSIRFESLL